RSAQMVVGARGDHARNRRAVPVVVGWISVAVDEVVAWHQRTAKIRLLRVDAGIDDRDDDAARAAGDVPGLREADDAEAVLLRPVVVVRARVEGLRDQLPRRIRDGRGAAQRSERL